MSAFLELRDYQETANTNVRVAELANPLVRLVVQGPTGSGKGVQIADLLTDDFPQMLVTHRRVLCEQLHGVLTRFGIRHGIRAAGYELVDAPIQLCMIQTERSRAGRMPPFEGCRRILLDELHSLKSNMVLDFLERFGKNASVIGFTATPSEVGHIVDDVVVSSTVSELIPEYLSPFIEYGPLTPDMEALAKIKRQINGDYSVTELDKFMPIKAIFGRMVDNWKLYNPEGLPTILFAPGVPQSLWCAQHLTSYGIPAAHIDCNEMWMNGEFLETNKDHIKYLRDQMEAGDIKIVCNRFILREGVDWPFLKCAVLATPFGSRLSYVQSVGRILRPHPMASRAIIIDHGGNWLAHPPLDSDEPWDIDTPQRILAAERMEDIREEKIPEPTICPKCCTVRVGGEACPECGYRYIMNSRWVFQANGTLKLVTGRAFRKRRVQAKPGQAKEWKGRFLGCRKYHPKRTPNQIYANMARESGWVYPPRDLPGMPNTQRGWFLPVGELTPGDLIDGRKVLA